MGLRGWEEGSSQYLTWEENEDLERREAFNHLGDFCGWLQLEQVGKHTHWCWYQNQGIYMSPGCLEQIRMKQKELYSNRKKEAK